MCNNNIKKIMTGRGQYAEVTRHPVDNTVVCRRNLGADDPPLAWRELFLRGINGVRNNPYLVVPEFTASMDVAVMPLCYGTLQNAVDRMMPGDSDNSVADMLRLCRYMLAQSVGAALHIMHQNGVVHGDIKADNIMVHLRPDDSSNNSSNKENLLVEWVLIDISLAQPGFVCGRAINSPATMPPEASGNPDYYRVGAARTARERCAADLWALGRMLQQLFALCRDSDSEAAAIAEILGPLLHPDPAQRCLPPLVCVGDIEVVPPKMEFAHATQVLSPRRSNLVDAVVRVCEAQPEARRCSAITCIAVQLVDQMLASASDDIIVAVCAHAASMVCVDPEPPNDMNVKGMAYRSLLIVCLQRIAVLPIGLQDPRLQDPQTLDYLIENPTCIQNYLPVFN